MYDICCFITGISSFGAPRTLLEANEYCEEEFWELLDSIISRLLATENAASELPPEDELRDTIEDLLIGCLHDFEFDVCNPIPLSMQSWHDIVVVIGPGYEDKKNPEGFSCVQLQVCRGYDGYGQFESVLHNGEWKDSLISARYPDIFMDARCWYYLKSWVTLQPLALTADPEMSFYTEFWEFIKDTPWTFLDYSPLPRTFDDGDGEESFFSSSDRIKYALEHMCIDGVPKLRQALRSGLRGESLGTALLDDFQMWAFESPDMWPCWSEEFFKEPVFMKFVSISQSTSALCFLPFENLLEIFADATPYDLLNVASTCKFLRQFLVRQDIFPIFLREMVLRGSLRWLNPSPFAENEVARANESLITWIGSKGREAVSNPFQDPGFPFLAFVYTCLVHSFSMRSRRRLWRIITNLEKHWIAFRNGK
ncbi:hypothetical protein DL96DRAFT_1608432 [Flagelloscypha sp. PMI_526]|nr:hypothetical protein DL96DRAFT_1608432 [Flagelloscypha sp. PMI_526]